MVALFFLNTPGLFDRPDYFRETVFYNITVNDGLIHQTLNSVIQDLKYAFYKYYDKISRLQNRDSHEALVFRMGEVFLNYAEAMHELGQFTHAVVDQTINTLRVRASLAPLDIANIPADPTRDAGVDPILWEIRREQGVEFLREGLGRIYDIKRWKKLVEYGGREKLGRWVKKSDYGNKLPIQGGAAGGYVSTWGGVARSSRALLPGADSF